MICDMPSGTYHLKQNTKTCYYFSEKLTFMVNTQKGGMYTFLHGANTGLILNQLILDNLRQSYVDWSNLQRCEWNTWIQMCLLID